jgi:hypothetical protein
MGKIIEVCDELWPPRVHGIACCRARGHKMPHRTVIIGQRASSDRRDRILIEWRPATDEEHWSRESVEDGP